MGGRGVRTNCTCPFTCSRGGPVSPPSGSYGEMGIGSVCGMAPCLYFVTCGYVEAPGMGARLVLFLIEK